MELYYATSNKDKFETVATYLKEQAPTIDLKPCTKDFVEIQSFDQLEIALHKAQQAWEYLKKPVLVDDSGVFFDTYHNFPGVLTKFVYQGIGLEGLKKLTTPGDKATFKLMLVFWFEPQQHRAFEGICHGTITHQTTFKGTPQFPYDALFIPDGSTKTYAELRQRNEHTPFDYRLNALRKFLSWYVQQQW